MEACMCMSVFFNSLNSRKRRNEKRKKNTKNTSQCDALNLSLCIRRCLAHSITLIANKIAHNDYV